ncbi:hypothetical protein QCA50_011346 [Cerrena zonata]|uniref:Uncharacterized protein n=1 Tax=Cerrena zonata TaxID=2478898 RepID=A0AAW0G705_9APHY
MSPARAAFQHPTFPDLAFVFYGAQYVIIDARLTGRNRNILFGPRSIRLDWPALAQAGFSTNVDAVLPNPHDKTTAYFFSGSKWALLRVSPPGSPQSALLVDGVKDFKDWKSLKEAQFNHIDAVLPITVGSDPNWAYIFSGDNYVSIQIDPVNGSRGNVRSIADQWGSLNKLGFGRSLDTILPVPGRPHEAYFFKGAKVSRIGNIIHNNWDDTPLDGDSAQAVVSNWPALHDAQFY